MAPLTLTWTHITTSPILQRSSQILATTPTTAYIFGGELRPREPRDNTIHTVPLTPPSQPSTLSHPSTSPLPAPRVGTASTLLSSTKTLYIFSGRGGPSMTPLSDGPGALYSLPLSPPSPPPSWSLVSPASPTAPVPEPRSYHALTSDGESKIYLHAGCPSSGRLRDLWSFDLPTKKWEKLPDAPGSERGGTSIAFADGRVWRVNGFDGKTEQGGALDVFDPKTGAWETETYPADGKQGPKARSVGCLLSMEVGGREVLVTAFGEGEASDLGHEGAGKFFGDVWAWDVRDGGWEEVVQKGERPERRGWFAADVAGEGIGVVQGGLAEGNERLGDLWMFKIESS
ncbi:kelch repeat protein [Elsinoe ampelina]|uniref:Kelch repeat protein n=1 Tax=Elsinoe ampelina TaxID=302913 RepID=A0A6A6GFQ6_9PEZI|nr:kelch repeat protein [Elsinoe ampelina]